MAMDRPQFQRTRLAALALISPLLLFGGGCRSVKSEVPPGKPYQTTGSEPPSVGFGSDPHPAQTGGLANLYANRGPSHAVQDGRNLPDLDQIQNQDLSYGTPTPTTNIYTPTENGYGPPGTSGLSETNPSSTKAIADEMIKKDPPISKVLSRASNAPPTETESFPK
jgi:hypothetical protein